MIKSQIAFLFRSRHFLFTVVFLLFGLCLSSQSKELSIYYVDALPIDILNDIEHNSSLKFHYSSDNLPSRRFTFSYDGLTTGVTRKLSVLFGLEVKEISPNNFAITKEKVTSNNGHKVFVLKDKYGAPLAGATAYIPRLDIGLISDRNGMFVIDGIYSRQEQFLISYLGYETLQTIYDDLGNKDITLKESNHILGDIVITDYLKVISSVDNIDRINVQNFPVAGSADQDVLGMSQSLAGIYNSSESLADLQIRGGAPDQVGYQWNGITLYQNSLFYGRISAVNPNVVEEVKINKEGASAGDFTHASGAIIMESTLKDTNRISGSLHADLLYINGTLGFSLLDNRWRTKVGVRRSIFDHYESKAFDNYFDNAFQFSKLPSNEEAIEKFNLGEDIETAYDFVFDDINLTSVLDISNRDQLRFDFLKFNNLFNYSWTQLYNGKQKTDSLTTETVGFNVKYNRQWSEKFRSQWSIGFSDYNKQYWYSTYRDDNARTNNGLAEWNAIYSNNYSWNPKYNMDFGYHLTGRNSTHLDTSESKPINEETFIDVSSTSHSFFAQLNATPADWISLQAGMRWTDYNKAALGRAIAEPRLHVSFMPDPRWTIHFHMGQFHQTTNRNNSFTSLQVDGGNWYIADETDEAQVYLYLIQNTQVSGGIAYNAGRLDLGATVYSKRINNIWTSAYDFYFTENPYAYANLEVKGLELSLQHQGRYHHFFWTYDYVDDKIVNESNDLEINSPYSQPHRLSFLNRFRYKGFDLTSKVNYASGRYFSQLDEYIEVPKSDGEIEHKLIYESLLNNSVDPYFNIDASISYTLKNKSRNHRYIKLGIHANNLLNTQNFIKNVYYIDYSGDPVDVALFRRKGLPFTLNFSLDMAF